MIRVDRPGTKIVIAEISGRILQLAVLQFRLLRLIQGEIDLSVPVHLVPKTMEDIQVSPMWKLFGQHLGYCLEFRKPL